MRTRIFLHQCNISVYIYILGCSSFITAASDYFNDDCVILSADTDTTAGGRMLHFLRTLSVFDFSAYGSLIFFSQ